MVVRLIEEKLPFIVMVPPPNTAKKVDKKNLRMKSKYKIGSKENLQTRWTPGVARGCTAVAESLIFLCFNYELGRWQLICMYMRNKFAQHCNDDKPSRRHNMRWKEWGKVQKKKIFRNIYTNPKLVRDYDHEATEYEYNRVSSAWNEQKKSLIHNLNKQIIEVRGTWGVFFQNVPRQFLSILKLWQARN